MGTKYDVIIVGARVAGASAAAFLSRAGFRVLLVDRVQFPRPTLSSPLFLSNTLEALGRLGVLPRVEAVGAPKLHLYQSIVGDIRLQGRLLPYCGYDYAYSIRRQVFDALMFEHVASLPNVEARLGFTVSGLVWADGRAVGVRGRTGGGQEELVYSDLVIGADGHDSLVARQTGAARYNLKPARTCVYFAYYSHVASAAPEPSATIYYAHTLPAVFITAESDAGLTVISLSLPAAQFEQARREHEALHGHYSSLIPEVGSRMAKARRETPVYGVPPRESFYRVPFGPGWALVGDAAFYKDPLTGQGIHDALLSSERVAQAYAETRGGGAWERAMMRYQIERDRETRDMYRLTDYYAALGRRLSWREVLLFRALSEMSEWTNRYVSLFNGVTDPGAFARPTTLLRILLEWSARRFIRRFAGPSIP